MNNVVISDAPTGYEILNGTYEYQGYESFTHLWYHETEGATCTLTDDDMVGGMLSWNSDPFNMPPQFYTSSHAPESGTWTGWVDVYEVGGVPTLTVDAGGTVEEGTASIAQDTAASATTVLQRSGAGTVVQASAVAAAAISTPVHVCDLAGGTLASARLASGHVLLDWVRLTFGANDILRYAFDEGTGNTITDAANGKNLDLTGSTFSWVDGWIGASAVKFAEGAGDTTTLTGVGAANSWTCEWWMDDHLPDGTNTTQTNRLSLGNTSVPRYFLVARQSGRYGTRYYSEGTTRTGVANYDCVVEGWTHYCVTYDYDTGDNGTLKVYHNGTLVNTITCARRALATVDRIVLGGGSVADSYSTFGGLVYASGVQRTTNFSPTRYPASGTWTEAADDAEANSIPAVLRVTLASALPTGTSLKCKLLSATQDTDWQTMTGSGTNYTYDFTGETADNWRAAVQLFSGGTLSANTPDITAVSFDYTTGGGTVFRPWLYSSAPLGGS